MTEQEREIVREFKRNLKLFLKKHDAEIDIFYDAEIQEAVFCLHPKPNIFIDIPIDECM
jgi:hypothetical protein